MQPIKTTNAINPAPAKGIESFPTPVIDDVVIAEVVNAWKGDYQKLEYGTLWKDVSHAPNQGSFPEHKLVFQQPTSEDGQWIKRIWVNDRVNQDSYNYAIKYSAGSQQHPIYIRNYVVPRETYTPLPDGTPDPLFPIALLVDEEANRIEGELDSKYVSVTRVYETLPGPEVPTKRYNERGDLETVIVQTVPPFTPPDPDGLLVTQSQVVQEEMGKGIKTTATVQDHALLQIKEKKEGLLGETITTDDIVDPATNPDELSQTIVASVVEQFSATKARKRTTTSSGPSSLTQKSNDGKLIGNVTVTESVVPPATNPDSVTTSILSSEVKQVDIGKAIKRNTVINSNPTLTSKRKSGGLMGNTRTVETVVPAGTEADTLNTVIIESVIEPINSSISRKATTSQEGPTTLVGGAFKDGLLGETVITESIVTASSTPDQLSQTVVSSTIEPIDSAKSKKTTITSTGPNSLSQRSNDGKLLGNVTSTQSVVSHSTGPDAVSDTILSSEVKQVDSGKAVKTNVVLNSTPTLTGNQNEEGLLGSKEVVESIVSSGTAADPLSMTVLSSSVEAIDSVRSKKTTITSTGPDILSGNQKKEGLLGEVNVVETIVAAGTTADELSETIVSSQVDPIDSAKSKKTTITSTGPTSLTQKSKDGKLLGDITSTKTIVSPNTTPNEVSDTILSSEVNQIDSGKAIKTDIILNSTPILSGNQNGEGLLGSKEVVESIVPAGTVADPLSTTVISSSVESIDSARSKKTTITSSGPASLSGGQKKEGLLGETVINESIVNSGSQPDNLSINVVSSTIEPIDSAKSKKTTVTSTGPTILNSNSLVDSPLGLVKARLSKNIVFPNQAPSTNGNTNFLRVKDSISPIDSAKSERETVDVSGWPTNFSVSGDEVVNIPIFYRETIESPISYRTDTSSGSFDVSTVDQWKGLSKRVDIAKFNTSIADIWYKLPSQIEITLPDILRSVKVYWGRSYGIADDYDFGSGAFTGSYNRNQSGSSKSSYSINGDVYFDVQKGFSGAVPGFTHIFFMQSTNLSASSVLAKLNGLASGGSLLPNTYSNWPYLQISRENLVLIGGSKSESKSKSLSKSVTINGFSSSDGSGRAFDINVSVNSIIIPETLHGQITISEDFIGNPPPVSSGLDVTYGVRPAILQESRAMLGGQQIPCPTFPTGDYLISATSELYKYGWAKITAKTANITSEYTTI